MLVLLVGSRRLTGGSLCLLLWLEDDYVKSSGEVRIGMQSSSRRFGDLAIGVPLN
jgi:hypothetical protein